MNFVPLLLIVIAMPLVMNNSYKEKMWVYALIDPRDGVMKYVGKCARPKDRFRTHCRFGGATPLGKWLTELRNLGIEPEMKMLGMAVAFSDDCIIDEIILDAAENPLIAYASGEYGDANLNVVGTERAKRAGKPRQFVPVAGWSDFEKRRSRKKAKAASTRKRTK